MIFAGFVIEPGIFQSDGYERAERHQHAFMLRSKSAVLFAFQVQHADQAILQ